MSRLLLSIVLNVAIAISINAQHSLWGAAQGGKGFGVLFKTNGDGTGLKVQKTFSSPFLGKAPMGSLVEAANGKLYGLTSRGGSSDKGVLFEYDPVNNSYSAKYEFDGTENGGFPNGSLIQTSDGKLYGMTLGGGVNDLGVLFEFDPSGGNYTKKFDFVDSTGSTPLGDLLEASNGKLYGLTISGGSNGAGVLFEFNPTTGDYINKINLADSVGSYPRGSLTEFNGKLYGVAGGGSIKDNQFGVIFEYDLATETYTDRYDFHDYDGNAPVGQLILANDKLYGLTRYGGGNASGAIFEYDPINHTFATKFDLGDVNGGFPRGGLLYASNGKLYGLTSANGDTGYGVIFEYDPVTDKFVKVYDFVHASGGGPVGSLIQASNGKLYGTALVGGKTDSGVIFEYDLANNKYTDKIDFAIAPDGSNPISLLLASDNKLYGMTHDGGKNESGVIFSIDPVTNNFEKKFDFDDSNNGGAKPNGNLLEVDGKFYGMANEGGDFGPGVVFRFDPTNGNYDHFSFNGTNGAYPVGHLTKAKNGKLYGLTYVGGGNLLGVLFEFDPQTGSLSSKYDFDNSNGSYPNGSLVLADNGKLYGMTPYGGDNYNGVLFEFEVENNNLIKRLNFGGASGSGIPFGSLIQFNGKLYGMTAYGGDSENGSLFEFDPVNGSFEIKYSFDGINGANPNGSLVLANGKLYGLTYNGGANGDGVLFEYDLTNGNYNNKYDFDGLTGINPAFELIFINHAPAARSLSDQQASQLLPFNFTFSETDFNDIDNDALMYSAQLPDGSSLPQWLTFDSQTRTFSGTPGRNDKSLMIRLIATDPSGASVSENFKILINVVTGVESSITGSINIYPNPAKDNVYIKIEDQINSNQCEFTVYSSSGQAMLKGIGREIDLSSLKSGLYLVECRAGELYYHSKIVKQ